MLFTREIEVPGGKYASLAAIFLGDEAKVRRYFEADHEREIMAEVRGGGYKGRGEFRHQWRKMEGGGYALLTQKRATYKVAPR